MGVFGKLRCINNAINKINFSEENETILNFSLLSSLIKDKYIPFNNMAMHPSCLAYLLNEIILNKRTRIVEFGSGISTILISRLIKQNNLKDCQFISFEHNKDWAELVEHEIETNSNIHIIHAPLERQTVGNYKINFYKSETLNTTLEKLQFKNIDLLIVDGPPAYNEEMQFNRMGAIPNVYSFLNLSSCAIILDDAQRNGEKQSLQEWTKLYKFKFSYYKRMSIAYLGEHFVASPF
jgi:hypothetical protein